MKRPKNNIVSFKSILLIISLCVFSAGVGQLNLPNTPFHNQFIDRAFLSDSSQNFYNTHIASKPIIDHKVDTDELYKSTGEHFYWITQKLFKEHFLVLEGEDYWCAIDPVLGLELGTDFKAADSLTALYWNTRGVRVQAKFFSNFALETKFYENQAVLPLYQNQFIDEHGEFVLNFNNTLYKQQNGVVPGYSRTKAFGVNGYDFAFAEGYLSYTPAKWMNLQVGNGNQFIGHGHRSLLLSDFTSNYPYLKPEFFAFNGRLQYTMTFAALQNLYRLPFHSTPESNFERKSGTFHYLEYSVNQNFQIGIFEGAVWRRLDSLRTYPLHALYFNPVIGPNTLLNWRLEPVFNSIIGLNASYAVGSNIIYGQLVVDGGDISGGQIGFKSYDVAIENLNAQVEFNIAKPNTYLSDYKRLNYNHSNLPLAHPFSAGFMEGIIRLNYNKGHYFVNNNFIYSSRIMNDSLNVGTSILMSNSNISETRHNNVVFNQLELGYRFNKNYNLQVYLGHLYRNEIYKTEHFKTSYFYFGVRTRIKNKTLDW